MREKLRYTATHAVQQEPIESARESNSFRLLLYRLVPRSRTITRTISCYTVRDGSYDSHGRCRHRGNHSLNCSCRADLEKAQAIKLRPGRLRPGRFLSHGN